VLDSTEHNSSVNIGTSAPGICPCCGTWSQLRPHWSQRDVNLCSACRTLVFNLEANSDIAHSVYHFWCEELGGAQ